MQDTQEPYVQCQPQNTAANDYQKQQYYRISEWNIREALEHNLPFTLGGHNNHKSRILT